MHRLIARLLLLLFAAVRAVTLLVGFALLAALLGTPAIGNEAEWLGVILDRTIAAGLVLTVTGGCLQALRRWSWQPAAPRSQERPTWSIALSLSLVLLSLLALLRCESLLVLWNLVAALLDEAGFQEEFARGGQGSGLVMLPVLVALLVPLLESLTAFFLVVVPLALPMLVLARSAELPRLYAMTVATQVGLTGCSLLAANTLARLVTSAMTGMNASGDPGVESAAETAAQLLGLVEATARGFLLPVVGHALWLPFLLSGEAPRSHFRNDPDGSPAA